MIKEFFLKQMLKSQMKDVPPAEQDKLIKLFCENEGLFTKIAQDAQVLMKEKGIDQMTATREVMMKYQNELKDLKI